VLLKGAAPDRSFSAVHGLAVRAADVVGHGSAAADANDGRDAPAGERRMFKGADLTRHWEMAANAEVAVSDEVAAEAPRIEMVTLRLRGMPSSNRRDDNSGRGERSP
jgi:hypothetical protein